MKIHILPASAHSMLVPLDIEAGDVIVAPRHSVFEHGKFDGVYLIEADNARVIMSPRDMPQPSIARAPGWLDALSKLFR